PCRNDDAQPAVWPEDRSVLLREDRVGVDVTAAGKWIAAGQPEHVTFRLGLALGPAELRVQVRVISLKSFDKACPGGLVGGLGDLLVPCGEELLLLELNALPRRVAQDAAEAAGPAGSVVDAGRVRVDRDAEDMRELQVPVEEAVLLGKRLQLCPGELLDLTRVLAELRQSVGGDGRCVLLRLRPDEGRAPGVMQLLLFQVLGRLEHLPVHGSLRAHLEEVAVLGLVDRDRAAGEAVVADAQPGFTEQFALDADVALLVSLALGLVALPERGSP